LSTLRVATLTCALLLILPLAAPFAGADAVADDSTSGARNVKDPSTVLSVGNPIRVVHFRDVLSVSPVVYPENGTIDYGQTYDLTLTALDSATVDPSAGTQYQLVAPSGTLVGPTRSAYADNEHCGQGAGAPLTYQRPCGAPYSFANLSFPNVRFNEGGVWLVTSETSGATVARFVVSPHTEIAVSLSRTSAAYNPEGSFSYILTAIYAANGTPVSGATIDVFPAGSGLANGVTTDASGSATVLQTGTPRANTYHYFVNASVADAVAGSCAPGDPVSACSDIMGEANLTVVPATLSFGASPSPDVGTQDPVALTPAFPDANGTLVWTGVQDTPGVSLGSGYFPNASTFNVSVTFPNGTVLYETGVTRGSLSYPVADFLASDHLRCFDPNDGSWLSGPGSPCSATAALASAFGVDQDTGQVFFQPGSLAWQPGAYTVAMRVNNDAAGGSEYAGAATLGSPTPPPELHLALMDEAGNPLSSLPVLPASQGALQPQTVKLLLTGATEDQHPAGGTVVVLVEGALLTGPGYGVVSYDEATGVATIAGLVPTGAGDVTFFAFSQDAAATLSVPTTGGALLSPSVGAITAGPPAGFSVFVRDANGNLVPTAQVDALFEDGTPVSPDLMPADPFPLQGNGAPGAGRGGVYDVNLTVASPRSLILQATLQPPGGEASYALARVDVLPDQAPSVAIGSPASGATVGGLLEVRGTASDPDGNPVSVQVRVDDGAWVPASGGESWTSLLDARSLSDGPHDVQAQASDGFLSSPIATTQVVVQNRVAPNVSIVSPSTLGPWSGDLLVQGRAGDLDGGALTVQVRVDQGAWMPARGGASWSRVVDTRVLSDGLHDVEAQALDGDLASPIAEAQFRVQNGAAPALAVDSPANSSVVSGTVVVTGRAYSPTSEIVSVQWSLPNGSLQTAFGKESWSFSFDSVPLTTAGTLEALVVATDARGVSTGAIVALHVDNRPDPAIAARDITVERAPIVTDAGSVPNVATEHRIVHVRVRNLGTVASEASTLDLTARSRDPTGLNGGAWSVDRVHVPAIPAGSSVIVDATWDTTGTVGDLDLCAAIDYANAERDTGNDAACTPQHVLLGGLGYGFRLPLLGL